MTGRSLVYSQYNQANAPVNPGPSDSGVPGSGEELAQTLDKVVSQLDLISRTLHVLEQRVSMNEESVTNVMEYFKEAKERRENAQNDVLQFNTNNNMLH